MLPYCQNKENRGILPCSFGYVNRRTPTPNSYIVELLHVVALPSSQLVPCPCTSYIHIVALPSSPHFLPHFLPYFRRLSRHDSVPDGQRTHFRHDRRPSSSSGARGAELGRPPWKNAKTARRRFRRSGGSPAPTLAIRLNRPVTRTSRRPRTPSRRERA